MGAVGSMEWVLYVDMDAFYVNCELLDREDLRGRPVIVGSEPGPGPTRAVVLSASYEARPTGVRSAMPVREAKRRCPEAVWIPPDFSKYAQRSHEVMAWLGRRFGSVIPQSIDEACATVDSAEEALVRSIAYGAQADLLRELRLPSSWGVASTRLVAKIASDRAKPAGVVVVPSAKVAEFLAPLPVRAIPGVGPKSETRLGELGVHTIGELAARRRAEMRRAFGEWGATLVALARGELEASSEASSDVGPVSRSSDRTFEVDVEDAHRLTEAVDVISRDLADALATEGLRFAAVGVAVRWADFTRVQRVRGLPGAVSDFESLRTLAQRLWRELWDEETRGRHRAVRTLTVRTERLSPAVPLQSSLDRFEGAGGADGDAPSPDP
ncbi:MAG: Y-family DNA polymerase [Thermoplasmata archaeon]